MKTCQKCEVSHGRALGRFLCRLGLHRYPPVSEHMRGTGFPDHVRCRRCGKDALRYG